MKLSPLLAAVLLVPAAASAALAPPPADALAAPIVARALHALDGLADVQASRDPVAAYAYARALVGLPSAPAHAPGVDARSYLASLAPGADFRALDALPPDAYAALGALLGAHAAAAEAVARGAGVAELEAIRATLVQRASALAPLAPGARAELPPVDVCGAVYLYLGEAPQTLACEHALSISGHGDDLYLNRAGGSAELGAALAIDLGGSDRYLANYTVSGGLNGGAFYGFGALVDFAGDDAYDAAAFRPWTGPGPAPVWWAYWPEGGVNGGGGEAGVGLLLDLDGSDSYFGATGNGGVNGGSSFGGSGALIDLGGADESFRGETHGKTSGVNGGANDAPGLFVHCGSGENSYTGTVQERGGVNGAGEQASSVFASCGGTFTRYHGVANGGGVNGGSSGDSQSVFVHLAGDAIIEGHTVYGGVNGGSIIGNAAAFVGPGDQTYVATMALREGGLNGGAVTGTGALVDVSGNDRYVASSPGTVGVNGAGMLGGVGALIDLGGGDDEYDAWSGGGQSFALEFFFGSIRGSAANGAGNVGGCGLLLDAGGADRYRSDPSGAWESDASLADPATCTNRLDLGEPVPAGNLHLATVGSSRREAAP